MPPYGFPISICLVAEYEEVTLKGLERRLRETAFRLDFKTTG